MDIRRLLIHGRSGRMHVLIALLCGALIAGVASAHVTINPPQLAVATFATFTVRVPTEQDEPTVKLRVEFPAGLTVSRFQPKPGWKRDVEKDSAGRLVAATWSGGQIGPDEYEDFVFLARTPNTPGRLVFKAYQTYRRGNTVAWVQGESQDNPAPVVDVVAGQPGSSGAVGSVENATPAGSQTAVVALPAATGTAAATAPAATAAATAGVTPNAGGTAEVPAAGGGSSAATSQSSSGSDLPLFTSLTALVVAVLGLALAGVALVRRRGTA